MKTLVVRTGGGLPGIDVHVGYWLALSELGIVGDTLNGTSAGAIVSAFDAAGWSAKDAASLVRTLRDEDVRDERPFWRLRLPFVKSIMRGEKMLALLHKYLGGVTEDDMRTSDLHIYATMVPYGYAVKMDWRAFGIPLCVAASSSVPVLFPAIELGGNKFVDGGLSRNFPLPNDIDEYDLVIVCDATMSDPERFAWRDRVLSSAVSSIRMMMSSQMWTAVERLQENENHIWLSVSVLHDHGLMRFDHSMIDVARKRALEMIKRSDVFKRHKARLARQRRSDCLVDCDGGAKHDKHDE